MRISPALLVVAWGTILAACGPSPGSDCDTTGYRCHSATSALECRDGHWRALPCRGPLGCRETEGQIDCDVSRNRVDDACAEAHEAYTICDPSGLALLECRLGTFQQTQSCSQCFSVGETFTCSP